MYPTLFEIPYARYLIWIGLAYLAWDLGRAVLRWISEGRGDSTRMGLDGLLLSIGAYFTVLNDKVQTLPVYAYGSMIMTGFVAAIWISSRRARRAGLDGAVILDVGMVAVIAGVGGARALYVWQFYDSQFAGRPLLDWIAIWNGGLVFYGGFIGATAAILYYLRRRGLPVLAYADIVAPTVPLALGLTRVGCFLNGCCWGAPCAQDHPLAVHFPKGSPAWLQQVERTLGPAAVDAYHRGEAFATGAARGLAELGLSEQAGSVLAIQLVASALGLTLFGLLSLYYFKFYRRRGEVLVLLGMGYPAMRFTLECFRGDTPYQPSPLTGLTISQSISVATFVTALAAFVWLRKKGEARPASPV